MWIPKEGRFEMWHAAGYFDESDDNDRAYAVAGFLGHQHDCVHLHFAWEEKILKKYDIEYFKASELEWGTGQFAKFRDDPKNLSSPFSEREKTLFREIKTASIDLILDFQIVGFGVVMMLPDYHRLNQELKRDGRIIQAPYFICSQLCMMEAGFIMWSLNCDSSPSQRGLVRPVFDSHEEYSGRAKQMFDDFAEKNPWCSKSLFPSHYKNDRDYLMLQAADNLAYEARLLLIVQEYDKHIPERKAMVR